MNATQNTMYTKGQLYNIIIDDLHPDPSQPRKYMDPEALNELTASIKQHGILEPILFRQDTDGTLYIVAGERRIAAARNAYLESVPGIFVEGSHAEISLVENLLRQDLTAVEEAEALKRLMDEQKYTQEQLSRIIGKATSTISEILSINKLPQEIRDECRTDPTISKNILIEIAKGKQQRGMLSLYKKYKAKKLSKEQKKRVAKSQSETVLTLMTDLTGKIGKLDVTQLADEEKESLRQALSALTQALEDKLSGF